MLAMDSVVLEHLGLLDSQRKAAFAALDGLTGSSRMPKVSPRITLSPKR